MGPATKRGCPVRQQVRSTDAYNSFHFRLCTTDGCRTVQLAALFGRRHFLRARVNSLTQIVRLIRACQLLRRYESCQSDDLQG